MGMFADAVGMQRAEAVWRIVVAIVWFPIYGTLLALIWFPVALVIAAIDVVIQLVGNGEGISYDETLMAPYESLVQTVEWVVSGRGSPSLIPYV